jgi:hypothetical protein
MFYRLQTTVDALFTLSCRRGRQQFVGPLLAENFIYWKADRK